MTPEKTTQGECPWKRQGPAVSRTHGEDGLAVLISLIALSVLSLLGLYMTFNATTEVKISDNYESQVQAREAATAGLAHAREAVRGISLDDLLQGPDGTYSTTESVLTEARTHSARSPISWNTARTLNIVDPSGDVAGLSDDGLVSTGKVGSVMGTLLIPKTGLAFTTPNPNGAGVFTTARYFVKVSDNNGEVSETATDPANNPFVDGDRTVIVRSTGVAQTIRETWAGTVRRNSVVVVETRLQRDAPFSNLGSPFVVIGSNVYPNFSGNAFKINGPSNGYGIATIDTNTTDGYSPTAIIKAGTGGKGRITGGCVPNNNCVGDITAAVTADSFQARLTDPVWLYDFVYNQVPSFADNIWDGTGTVDLGTPTSPKTTYVHGDISLTGGIEGAGMLVVTGNLFLGGDFVWDGLVIVTGTGFIWTHGMNRGIYGGVIVANLQLDSNGVPIFGVPTLDIRGNSDITTYDSGLTVKANGLVPMKQLTFREITSVIDP